MSFYFHYCVVWADKKQNSNLFYLFESMLRLLFRLNLHVLQNQLAAYTIIERNT